MFKRRGEKYEFTSVQSPPPASLRSTRRRLAISSAFMRNSEYIVIRFYTLLFAIIGLRSFRFKTTTSPNFKNFNFEKDGFTYRTECWAEKIHGENIPWFIIWVEAFRLAYDKNGNIDRNKSTSFEAFFDPQAKGRWIASNSAESDSFRKVHTLVCIEINVIFSDRWSIN